MTNNGVRVATSIIPSIVTNAKQVIVIDMITLALAMIQYASIVIQITATTAMIAMRTTTMMTRVSAN